MQRRQRTGRRQVAIRCADDKQLRHRSCSSGGIPVRVSGEEGLTEAPGRRCRGRRRRRRRPGCQSPSCAGCRAATGGGTAAAAAALQAPQARCWGSPKTPLKMEAGGGALGSARRPGTLAGRRRGRRAAGARTARPARPRATPRAGASWGRTAWPRAGQAVPTVQQGRRAVLPSPRPQPGRPAASEEAAARHRGRKGGKKGGKRKKRGRERLP